MALKPGANPRKEVVPLMRKNKMSVLNIKLFKRLLKFHAVRFPTRI